MYGTTSLGGAGAGTVFRITPTGQFNVVHTIPADRLVGPVGEIIEGRDGNLYGTTQGAGGPPPNYGTIFKLTPNGNVTWVHQVAFGHFVPAALLQAADGFFYGVTSLGGQKNLGNVFSVAPDGTVTRTHEFHGDTTGAIPAARLIQATDGNLYGTTYGGDGTVFRLTPGGTFSTNDFDLAGAAPILGHRCFKPQMATFTERRPRAEHLAAARFSG